MDVELNSTVSDSIPELNKNKLSALEMILKACWIPAVVMFVLAILTSLSALLDDKWAIVSIKYSNGSAIGHSQTILGAYCMYRKDYVTLETSNLTYKSKIYFAGLAAGPYCSATAKSPGNSLPIDGQVLRRIDQVGNVDGAAEEQFVRENGRVIYDVLCSGLPTLAKAGNMIAILGWMSAVFFYMTAYFCYKRIIDNVIYEGSLPYKLIQILTAVIWLVSWIFAAVATLCYWLFSREDNCVDALGKLTKCQLTSSTHLFVVYVISNGLAFLCYLLYGISLRRGVAHSPFRVPKLPWLSKKQVRV
ncbi:uncharacterized protein BcabD6B2_34750 [Babesia caballi]|uniref:Uncharacterized protein n=1 Tax=Babesia caballi TaxID=5871 RepID=A0AAV4LWB3_BABCB|nr:hypothetical protein BcabD6B2_34750 [Babesia caballi]